MRRFLYAKEDFADAYFFEIVTDYTILEERYVTDYRSASICTGLYAKLQEEPTIALKDGMAMMDSLNNGMQRITLGVNGGNYELGYENGVITLLTVFFAENWESTTEGTNATTGSTFGQDAESELNLNLGQYKFFGKSFTSWKVEDLADYVRNTYELEYDDGDQESFFMTGAGSEDRIWINTMIDGGMSVVVSYVDGAIVSVASDPKGERTYTIDCGWTDSTSLEGAGAAELEQLFNMTPREYFESVKPGLYDTLVVDESLRFETSGDTVRYILLSSDGSLRIQSGSVAISLIPSQETGLIDYFSVTIY